MMSSAKTSLLGKWAEEKATNYLIRQGMEILAKNYRSVHGEIDIIAKDHNILVLVEVKTRKASQKKWLEDAISPSKIKRILKTAEIYIEKSNIKFEEMRVDVIWLIRNRSSFHMKHLKAFA